MARLSDLSADQERVNAWVRQGWRGVWEPTRLNPRRSQRLWSWADADGLIRLALGGKSPPVRGNGDFYVNDGQVYRSESHPEGPSSIPWYVIRRAKAYPAEGYPSGAADVAHFELRHLEAKGTSPVVRANPDFGNGLGDPPAQ